jgi:ABC-type nitrate/sulfonate/bicarbonate transport system permease component
MLMLLALMPLALAALGLPTEASVMLVIAYISICSALGFISYRFLALPRREQEMADLMSMSRFMVWDLLKQIQEEQIRQRPKKKTGGKKK